MEHPDLIGSAVLQLAALAQATRLSAFLLLIRAGKAGVMQGELARALNIPAQTLSFHLKQLTAARLVRSQRVGTAIYYSADFDEARRLANFFSENCCVKSDGSRGIASKKARKR